MSGKFPPVVFVHGYLCSALVWVKQFNDKHLLDNLYMTRGHGRSDQPESPDAYASEKHAEDFQAVCAAFNVTKPTVVTWSLGGVVVADVLSRYGTSPLPVAGYVPSSHNTTVMSSLLSPQTTEFQTALKAFINAFVAPGKSITFEDQCAWIGSAMGMDETAIRSVANELPILCIQGTDDVLIDSKKHEELVKKHFGDNMDYQRLPGAGHACFYDLPEVVNPMITQFVQCVYESSS
ncbi:alpha/beta-hydrolase [Armillaria luteobubalina]|uniref:Alpha/beta-hydrolase n=1 Tax=Armillaria luteobubalina TaxID=153913 RepID=A0AA39PHF4_9AGAR|nr:alpha/beta-hydrolase [Armillaria luteobubalina]